MQNKSSEYIATYSALMVERNKIISEYDSRIAKCNADFVASITSFRRDEIVKVNAKEFLIDRFKIKIFGKEELGRDIVQLLIMGYYLNEKGRPYSKINQVVIFSSEKEYEGTDRVIPYKSKEKKSGFVFPGPFTLDGILFTQTGQFTDYIRDTYGIKKWIVFNKLKQGFTPEQCKIK